MRQLCRKHGILFSVVSSSHSTMMDKVYTLIRDFASHNKDFNRVLARSKIHEALEPYKGLLETVLILDTDRTLAAKNAGQLF